MLSIGEVAKRMGLRTSTIRYYESANRAMPAGFTERFLAARPRGCSSVPEPMGRWLNHFQNDAIRVPQVTGVAALVDASGDGIRR